jgi:RNA recognition motif 2/RNA recognition motif. (a.k.a. RRM, RBD, or RNP domain)
LYFALFSRIPRFPSTDIMMNHSYDNPTNSSAFGDRMLALTAGDALLFERPNSAPPLPPPGFYGSTKEDAEVDPSSHHSFPLWEIAPPRRASSTAVGDRPEDEAAPLEAVKRNHSFTNLAVAVLGSGLLESMEATAGDHEDSGNNGDLLSYHRMKRHLASRLIGQSAPAAPAVAPTKAPPPPAMVNHSLFSHHQNGQHNRSGLTSLEVVPTSMPAHHQLGAELDLSPYEALAGSSSGTVLSAPSKTTNHHHFQHHNERLFTTSSSISSHSPHLSIHGDAADVLRRSTTPVQLYPGRVFPHTKDIGMNVVEPPEEDGAIFNSRTITGVISQRIDPNGGGSLHTDPTVGSDSNRSLKELERGMQIMWSPEAREFQPSSLPPLTGPPSGNSSISDPVTASEFSSRQADLDIQPFCWDTHTSKYVSRTLVVLHVSWLRVPDVRSACETFGVLESFRADFASRGIFFVSYYDIRSAQYASVELQSILQRLSVMQRSSDEVVVKFCVSLSSSSQFDDSHLVIYNLSPHEMKEATLMPLLSSYGAVRMLSFLENGACLVEFQNSQDTKQALLELDSTHPWGPHVIVEVKTRDEMERRRGHDLLAILGRWRSALNRSLPHSGPPVVMEQQYGSHSRGSGGGYSTSASNPWYLPPDPNTRIPHHHHPHASETVQPQYVLGPDGRYTQVYVSPRSGGGGYNHPNHAPHHYDYVGGIPSEVPSRSLGGGGGYPQRSAGYHPAASSNPAALRSYPSHAPYMDRRYPPPGVSHIATPYYAHTVTPMTTADSSSSLLGRSMRSGHSTGGPSTDPSHPTGGGGDKGHLLMDLDLVELGHDTRTSLMVRNIPNKYTQQMLLSEFEANGHGPGIIDFFYLPIDFKNRCNRGYAFINFVYYKDILSFHRRYFGKHWRTFNSDKICDITYARIQGKDAMLKRFENSALMEKDDEYKPLVFASDGPNRGTRLPFPDPNMQYNNSNNHGHHPSQQHTFRPMMNAIVDGQAEV